MADFKAKCAKFNFGWGSAPDPVGELTAYSIYTASEQQNQCHVINVTQRRSEAKNVGCFQLRLFVCLSVCLFVNMITSERVNIA